MGGAGLIILDTHVWVWWVSGDAALSAVHRDLIREQEAIGIAISPMSCWEVAMLFDRGRLVASVGALEWIERAVKYPGVRLVELSPRIAVDSTTLPGDFHRDPADRILVATARALDCPLITADARILEYPHVRTVGPTLKR